MVRSHANDIEEVRKEHLAKWIRNLPRLETLRIWSGSALQAGAGTAIRETCPYFRALTIFDWYSSLGDCRDTHSYRGTRTDESADQEFATFLTDLAPNSLAYFETISVSQIASQSFTALSAQHSSSLQELRLAALSESALKSLDKLSACTNLRTLSLEDTAGVLRLEESQNDVFIALIDWLSSCRYLQSLDIKRLFDGPAILSAVLEKSPPPLTKLSVEGYHMLHPSASNFHSSIPFIAATLTSLSLRADGEDAMPVDLDLLVNSITQLPLLQDLYLKELSENFTNDHITTLALSLPNLVELWTSGSEITDQVFPALSTLRNLKTLFMYATTHFTFAGICDFVDSLQPAPVGDDSDGNRGFWLSIMNAEMNSALSESEQSDIRNLIEEKLGGRFEFTLSRGESRSRHRRWEREHDVIGLDVFVGD